MTPYHHSTSRWFPSPPFVRQLPPNNDGKCDSTTTFFMSRSAVDEAHETKEIWQVLHNQLCSPYKYILHLIPYCSLLNKLYSETRLTSHIVWRWTVRRLTIAFASRVATWREVWLSFQDWMDECVVIMYHGRCVHWLILLRWHNSNPSLDK